MGLTNALSKRIEKIEQQKRTDDYLPVLILDSEDDLEENRHLIGPNTVVIIDDIGETV